MSARVQGWLSGNRTFIGQMLSLVVWAGYRLLRLALPAHVARAPVANPGGQRVESLHVAK